LVSYSFDTDSSRVRRNKSGEDRSSDLGDLDVELNPPKAHFSAYANAFEFGPRDFDAEEILPPFLPLPSNLPNRT